MTDSATFKALVVHETRTDADWLAEDPAIEPGRRIGILDATTGQVIAEKMGALHPSATPPRLMTYSELGLLHVGQQGPAGPAFLNIAGFTGVTDITLGSGITATQDPQTGVVTLTGSGGGGGNPPVYFNAPNNSTVVENAWTDWPGLTDLPVDQGGHYDATFLGSIWKGNTSQCRLVDHTGALLISGAAVYSGTGGNYANAGQYLMGDFVAPGATVSMQYHVTGTADIGNGVSVIPGADPSRSAVLRLQKR